MISASMFFNENCHKIFVLKEKFSVFNSFLKLQSGAHMYVETGLHTICL